MAKRQGLYHLVADRDDDGDDDVSINRPARKRRTIACVAFCLVLIMLTLAGVGVALYFTVFKKTDNSPSNSPDCITPGVCNSKLLDYIDKSFDPCDDFYKYSCGKWLSANPLGDRQEWGTVYTLAINNYDHLMEYLSQPVRIDDDPAAIRKAKYIYAACKDVNFIESNLARHLDDFIKSAGGWADVAILPDAGWDIDTDLVRDHYLGSSAFFDFGIEPDDLNSSAYVIKISQGGLTLDSPEKYDDPQGEDFLDLVDEIKGILDVVNPLDLEGDNMLLATEIASYEQLLASEWLTDTELRNLTAIYNPMTLEELQDMFNLTWVNYFQSIFNQAGLLFEEITLDTVVIVETPDYFAGINDYVFGESYQSTTINYAKWQLLLKEVAYSAASLSNGWDIIHKVKFPSSSSNEATKLACVQTVENAMPLAIARPFVEEFISDEVIQKVNATANEILKTFIVRVMQKDWLDDYTKGRCVEKVEAITRQIAYPDFIKMDEKLDKYYEKLAIGPLDNYFEIGSAIREFGYYQLLSKYTKPVNKFEWPSAPTEVNAYYSPPSNQFIFQAGILRPPFFATNWPPFIGAVIGHELSHGFDDQGQQYDENGDRVQWWTDKSITEFNQRTHCFVDQYDQYSLQGYPIDGQLTLGENIADNGGVHTAFQAYKNVMNGTTEKQSLIGGHTLDQLFFVSFAQLWCSKYEDKYLETYTQTEEHSPSPIRVLGSLVNSKEFATAFNCPERSRMNPIQKCQLW